ncbi:MAG TPA: TetR/AcrR family transcriptional regulator [Acidimicrobiia bacterium]|jgi:AcrR family transcriptional regulator|nr:TetR/AcrR family transcriptional regulator [Acidimicrobiia bacterium]
MTATPGRPRSFEPEDVLAKALEVFWRTGYRATTTRMLEKELGLSQSSIYNAFGSKRQLLLAALTTYEDQITTELVGPLEHAEDGLVGVHRFFDDLARWVTDGGKRGCMIINLMAEDAGESDEITKRTRAYRERVRSALEGALSHSDVPDAAPKADLLYGMVLGLNIAARGGGLTEEVERLVGSAHAVVASWT